MHQSKVESPRSSVPFLTVGWIVATIFVTLSGWSDRLVWLRASDDWWRWWSHSMVHFSPSHLAWNLILFAPVGIWAERVAPRAVAVVFVLAPPLSVWAVRQFDPGVNEFGGLSALAIGLLVLLAVRQMQDGPQARRRVWVVVLLAVTVKIGFEFAAKAPVFARFAAAEVRPVPIAHVAAAVVGLVALARRRSRGQGS
jgi:rhomboid family GlyGly-CTERM serine protease